MPRIEVISWRTDNHWMHDHLFLPVMFLINKYNCIFPPAFSEETTHFCNNYFCFKIQMNIILMRLRINRSWIIYIDFLLRQSTSYIPHPIVIKGISSNDFVQRFEIKKIGYYEISFTMVYGKRNINVLSKLSFLAQMSYPVNFSSHSDWRNFSKYCLGGSNSIKLYREERLSDT